MIKIISTSKSVLVEVNNQHTIGTYSTEEKAISVLDMIQNAKLANAAIFAMPQDNEI